jgi:AcrR family transcriptional regulator
LLAVISRPIRADAQRNRERLLEVAVQAFSHDGADASLEAIARKAGVGIGTLYRHFPTREALVEAAYRNELARLCDSTGDLLASSPPDVAVRAWMGRFIDYMATKRGMADALRAVIASGGNPYEQSRARLLDGIRQGTGLDAPSWDASNPREGGFIFARDVWPEKRRPPSKVAEQTGTCSVFPPLHVGSESPQPGARSSSPCSGRRDGSLPPAGNGRNGLGT